MSAPHGVCPAALGYRWPAEWEPHEATWLSWPHNAETWPGERLARVQATFAELAGRLAGHERVRIHVGSEALEAQARAAIRAAGFDPDRGMDFLRVPTHDAWVRDHGGIFVVRDGAGGRRDRAVLDFRFDNWGRKYPGWELDDAVPRAMAQFLDLPRFEADFVLEGGAVDGDGAGTVLTTESCLLNPNREPGGRTREQMEVRLADWLGARRVLWLGEGIEGDDTDGHVDDVARFVAPGVVVAAVCDDPADPNHAPLAENRRRLAAMADARGAPLTVVELPMPPRLAGPHGPAPASYVNFYIANGLVLAPTFGSPSDGRALAALAELFPKRDVAGIPSADLVAGLGALHCVTQQEPAASVPPGMALSGRPPKSA